MYRLNRPFSESIQPTHANHQDDARVDLRARSFWTAQQCAFFDVRVFYPHAQSYSSRSLPSLFASFENEKKRAYGDRITQVEHGTFTPLVFSSCGGAGKETNIALKRLGTLLAEKQQEQYSHSIGLLRLKLSFALIRSSLVCLRGSRRLRTIDSHDLNAPSLLVLSESGAHA